MSAQPATSAVVASGKWDPDELLTTVQAARAARRAPGTVRSWASRGWLVEAGRMTPAHPGRTGQPLYRRGDVMDLERATRAGSGRAAAAAAARSLDVVGG